MTRIITSPTRSASMRPTVSPLGTVGKSPDQPWLGALARRWDLRPSYTRQQVFADFGVFDRSAEAAEEMFKDGRAELVALRCAKLDAVRAAHSLVNPTTAEHRIHLHENFERDARENPATAAHAMEPNQVTWSTARRLLIAEIHAKLQLLRSGDCLYQNRNQ